MTDLRINGLSVPGIENARKAGSSAGTGNQAFASELETACEKADLRFSKHAANRLERREMNINAEHIEKMGAALDNAGRKGAHNSLVLLEENAFVVNVDARTVLTAMRQERMKEGIITNIDSTIIVR